MDEGSAPPRIEIELTEHEGKRSRRDRQRGQQAAAPTASAVPWSGSGPPDGGVFSPAVDPGRPGAGSDGPLRSERNRLVVTGLAVGAIALFIGWALGRSGGDGDGSAQTVDGATTTTVDDRATDASVVAGDTLPAAELPATTRPRPTTTTTLPPVWQVSTVEIDPRLAGATDRIVAITDDGGLVELDLVAGEASHLPAPSPRTTGFPPIAGHDWIVLQFDDGRSPLLYRDGDAEGRPFTLRDSIPSNLWQYGTDLFWSVQYDPTTGEATDVVEYGLDSRPTGRSIDAHGFWPSGTDPAGGVLIGDGLVGFFTVTPDGSKRLPPGKPIAMSVGHLLVYVCAEDLESCGLSLVDRSSGATVPVPTDDELDGQLNRGGWWWGGIPPAPMITRDARAALINVVGDFGNPVAAVLDLATGERTTLHTAQNPNGPFLYPDATWSADGRFVFHVADSVISAYDRSTGETFPVVASVGAAEALERVRSLTVRPPAG